MKKIVNCLFVAICLCGGMTSGKTRAGTIFPYLIPLAPGGVADLTAGGAIDWADWGLSPTNLFNHKNGVGQITDCTILGPNAPVQYSTNLLGYSWTNGQPTVAATNTTTGLLVAGLTNGFSLSVPADTNPRRLRIYVGVNAAQGLLAATLGDGSAPAYFDASLDAAGTTTSNGVYTINYAANSAGQALSVQFTVSTLYDVGGSVTLQAATLDSNAPPTVAITQPTNNTFFPSPGNIMLAASAADSDGTVSEVDFYAGANLVGIATNSPYSLTWTVTVAGAYTLTAVAVDNDGGTNTSTPVNITVAPNPPPTVVIVSPTQDADFSAPAGVPITATASSLAATVTNVQFFAAGKPVGQVTNPPYTLTWTGMVAGIYDLTAQATDNNGAVGFSDPVTVFVTTNGGALAGSAAAVAAGSAVDLTTEGTNDWVHWGLFTQNSFNHKAGVAPQISDYFAVNAGPNEYFQFADNANGYSWWDGTPDTTATNTTTGIYVVGVGTGFDLEAPATTNAATLRVYVGAFGARGRLRAYLSDFSAHIYLDTSLSNLSNGPGVVYALTYASASPGQMLFVRYTAQESYDPFGNVTLQAATLATGNSPPTVAIISPTNYAGLPAPANLAITAAAADPDGSVTNVAFFQGTTLLAQVTNGPYSFTWTNVPVGTYVLTATATDNQGTTYTCPPVTVFVISNGGVMRPYLNPAPSTVDLTAEGKADWGDWGVPYPPPPGKKGFFNHKRNVVSQISDVSSVGKSDFQLFGDNTINYTWTDGTPILSTNGTVGIYKNNLGEGFLITAPADTMLRRLKVYAGAFAGQGRLEATLSDFSSAPFIDTSLANVNSTSAVYTLIYAARSPSQKLTVKYTSAELFDEAYGNVTFQAAALASAVPLLQPLNPMPANVFGFSFTAEQGLKYAVQFSDCVCSTNWQTLTNFTGTGADVTITQPMSTNRFYRVKLSL